MSYAVQDFTEIEGCPEIEEFSERQDFAEIEDFNQSLAGDDD